MRQHLARTALSAALTVDGVVGATAGRLRTHVTPVGAELLEGVTVAAEEPGRYSVDLFLICRPVALRPLAARVRERVYRSAVLASLESQLGPVGVHIEDIAEGLS